MTTPPIFDATRLMTLRELHLAHFPEVTLHQLKYALDLYRIEPIKRAGIVRLFTLDQVPSIRSALSRVADRRTLGW